MKKILIKVAVFMTVFLVTLVAADKLINQGHNNMTMEMAEASLPVLSVVRDGFSYNELHGYTRPMDTAFERDTVTVLGENRGIGIRGDLYGRTVLALEIEVRSVDGDRLIEKTPVNQFAVEQDVLTADFSLKDLIDQDQEYMLTMILTLEDDSNVYYYTRILWSKNSFVNEKLEFVRDFHERLYDREAARELTKYLETNSQLEDNSSFHRVNIHSSFKQITWGNLNVRQEQDAVYQLTEITDQTASVLVNSLVSSHVENTEKRYRVQEYFRLRYTPDRIYLLDYERTMTQLPDVEHMYANDKILLGITDADVPMVESEDGSNVVFEVDNQLYSYNAVTNKLTIIFSFYNLENPDARSFYDRHSIKILDVTEGGNVSFAVYGYMNRGRHEGEVGIQIYTYNSALNTIEENIYIPYNKNYSVLKVQMDQLLYLNREQKLYIMLEDVTYVVNLQEKTYAPLVEITQDDSMKVAENDRILVWLDGSDLYNSKELNVRNLNTEEQNIIQVGADEAVRPLGFMGEDLIYGVARVSDIKKENSGRIFFPMYKVCIADSEGNVLKEYSQAGIYITDCSVEANQIILNRIQLQENGTFKEITQDQIMNSIEGEAGKYKIVAPTIDIYEQYVQIQTRETIDSKTIQILTPKEVVFEGGRELVLEAQGNLNRFFVYGAFGVEGIYSAPAKAVQLAASISGTVINQDGRIVWRKESRMSRNQIMAIRENQVTAESDSLAVCLDVILMYEGVMRNTALLLEQGQTVSDILLENMENMQVLDLAGCDLDAVLYYVNKDLPVLALLNNGEAVLITGFNESQVVIMDPVKGTLAKQGMNAAASWLQENGNNFVTYISTQN